MTLEARGLVALGALAVAACAASAPVAGRAATPALAPLQCTLDPREADDSLARAARVEHCSGTHWLGRLGMPCLAAMRYYSARSLAALSACTDARFASPPADVSAEELARRAGQECTREILERAPAAACSRRVMAREVCARALRCGRAAAIPGCATRGEAELHPAVADTIGLWNDTGRAALAECIGALPCQRDPRPATQVECLAANFSGGT